MESRPLIQRHWSIYFSLYVWSVMGCIAVNGQTGEVSGYGGAGFGTLGTHGWVGGASGVEFSKYGLVLIDTSFLPLGNRILPNYNFIASKSRLYDFNFTVQVQVPLKHRWAPYALIGNAVLLNTYRVEELESTGAIQQASRRDAKYGFETGGGARFFIRESWGLKGEYRYTISSKNFNRIAGGVFYQFQGPWPFLPRASSRNRRQRSQ